VPNWKFHNRWARQMGISAKVSSRVNWIMDAGPAKTGKPVDLEALSRKGTEFKKAWMLHELLDILQHSGVFHYADEPYWALHNVDLNVNEWKKWVEWCSERDLVEQFVRDNLDEILSELLQEYGRSF